MEIQFTNIDNLWVAEFEVTSDFNLHLERDTEGRLDIYQRTAGGDYEYIYDIGYLNKRAVYDNDFQALVYPKWIKIKSAVKPLVATITTDGEVNEVVYQAKDIEITSNGTTKVTADTGYTALGSVNVKVNVPTEGGGRGENTLEYIDVRNIDRDLKFGLINSSSLVKIIDGTTYIWPALFGHRDFGEDLYEYTTAIAIDFSCKVTSGDGFETIKEMISTDNGFPLNVFDSLPRITKEEFYHIPKIVNIDSMSSDEIKVVFEDLYSQLSLKYNIGDTFDDELSLYGYKEIILGGNSFTKVGQIYSFSEDDILIRLGSEEIPYSQGWGLIRSKVDGDIFYNPQFPG